MSEHSSSHTRTGLVCWAIKDTWLFVFLALALTLGGCVSAGAPSQLTNEDAQQGQEGQGEQISVGDAEDIAVQDSGVAQDGLVSLSVKRGSGDSEGSFEVEFSTEKMEYRYRIDAFDGTIVDKGFDRIEASGAEADKNEGKSGAAGGNTGAAASDDARGAVSDAVTGQTADGSKDAAKNEPKAQEAKGYISASEAKDIAASHAGYTVSSVTFTQVERDTEDGKVIFELEFYADGCGYDYVLDAQSGTILGWEREADGQGATDYGWQSLAAEDTVVNFDPDEDWDDDDRDDWDDDGDDGDDRDDGEDDD